jgi:hypothetical protein
MFAKINTEQKVCNKEDPNFRLAYKHSFAIKKTAQSKYSRKFVQSGQPACFSKDISDCRRYFEQTMTQQISDRNQSDTFESLHQALRCIHSVWHIPKSTSVFSIWSCQSFQRSARNRCKYFVVRMKTLTRQDVSRRYTNMCKISYKFAKNESYQSYGYL